MEYKFIDVFQSTDNHVATPAPPPANHPKEQASGGEQGGFTKFVPSTSWPAVIHSPISSVIEHEPAPVTVPDSETIVVENASPHQLPNTGTWPSQRKPGKLYTQYMLADGTVVTGKGLGRGRPGIKRGPRKSKLSEEISTQITTETPSTSNSTGSLTPAPSSYKETPTHSKPKRKRTTSDASIIRVDEAELTPSSRESTPEYNPTSTHTRSGRQTQRPVPITNISASSSTTPGISNALTSPAPKRPPLSTTNSTPTIKRHPKIKPKVYRGREAFALCEHCLRGNGPTGNVIVFCDACNKCWHQRCHEPQISKSIVADRQAEWFCGGCDRILHGKKKAAKSQPPTPQQQQIPQTPAPVPQSPPAPRYGPPLVGGQSLTLAQRRAYLQTLSKERLVALCLHVADLAPQLPMFETLLPPPQYTPPPPFGPSAAFPITPTFSSSYVTPVDKPVVAGSGTPKAAEEIEDEGYVDDFDEHAALYPKPGEGVQLPPESTDLGMLLEGPGVGTFSHWVRGMEMKTTL